MDIDNEKSLSELKSIKRWVIALAIGFVLVGIGAVVFSVAIYQGVAMADEWTSNKCEAKSEGFDDERVRYLLSEGDIDEALVMIDERLETHPQDSYAAYAKARAHYLLEDWDIALQFIEKTEFLAPTWKKDYTNPMRENIKKFSNSVR